MLYTRQPNSHSVTFRRANSRDVESIRWARSCSGLNLLKEREGECVNKMYMRYELSMFLTRNQSVYAIIDARSKNDYY